MNTQFFRNSKLLFRKSFAAFAFICCTNTLFAQRDALYIAPSGNVGIGTASDPVNKLEMGGDLHMDGNAIYLRQNTRDKFDIIKWNSGTDKIDIAGYTGVTLGYTGNGPDGSVKPALTVGPTGNVDIPKTLTAAAVKDNTGFVTPKGGIIMYAGSMGDFDMTGANPGKGKGGTAVEGWAICNGKNGTPNLVNKFITAAGGTTATDYKVGVTGGTDYQTLTTSQMPPHFHKWAFGCDNKGGSGLAGAADGRQSSSPCLWGVTSTEGGGQAFDNRPAYYPLLYIMKL